VSLRKLHVLGSPILRQRAEPVPGVDDAVRRLIDDLFETMYAAKGVGLAANQVGIAQRVAVVDTGGETPDPLVLVNPAIVQRGAETESAEEGCLSIPEIFGDVERPVAIVVEATDRTGTPFRLEASGYRARAIQHEIDHLDGVLFTDRMSPGAVLRPVEQEESVASSQ